MVAHQTFLPFLPFLTFLPFILLLCHPMQQKTLLTGTVFAAVLLALGGADALFTGARTVLPSPLAATVTEAGIVKNNGPTVGEVLKSLGIETTASSTQSLLARIAGETGKVQSMVLLKNNDRIASFSWMESPDVKRTFSALKDALHSSFSGTVTDLTDEVRTTPDRPVSNFLTFRDTGIDPERLVFLRVRERLYELHVADGKEVEVNALLEALSK